MSYNDDYQYDVPGLDDYLNRMVDPVAAEAKRFDALSEDEQMATIEQMFEQAQKTEWTPTCVYCKKKMYYQPGSKALKEGHIYSEAGKREVGITGICEFCFDKATEVDEDADPAFMLTPMTIEEANVLIDDHYEGLTASEDYQVDGE